MKLIRPIAEKKDGGWKSVEAGWWQRKQYLQAQNENAKTKQFYTAKKEPLKRRSFFRPKNLGWDDIFKNCKNN